MKTYLGGIQPIPIGTLCNECGEYEATVRFSKEGGLWGLTHGNVEPYCEVCYLHVCIAYAQEQADKIPEYENRLQKLLIERALKEKRNE